MLNIGAASIIINGRIGAPIQGATVNQVASQIRDDLEANALLMEGRDTTVLLISCDLIGPRNDFILAARKRIADATGLPERGVIIASTHTHAGPSIAKTQGTKPVDVEYLAALSDWLVELAVKAKESVRPARVGWNSGRAKIGYNRRACFADGSHELGGDVSREDFTGMEGPEDDGHCVLCAIDEEDRPIAIAHCNTSHATSFYGCDFFSADYPGASRAFLRTAFGDIPVLYLNGTIGDTNPDNRFSPNRVCDREQRMLQQAHLITGETMRQIYTMPFQEEVAFGHAFEDLQIPLRLPSAEELRHARAVVTAVEEGKHASAWDRVFSFGALWLHEYAQKNPVETVPVHVVRVGDFAVVTQSCELFTHFGLEIKRRSPYSATAICSVADGYSGYCPTLGAILGGGFTGRAIDSSLLSHDAGDRIVEAACRMLYALWRSSGQ